MITLRCLKDGCPITGEAVDFRSCACCQWFEHQVIFGTVVCGHENGIQASNEEIIEAVIQSSKLEKMIYTMIADKAIDKILVKLKEGDLK
jgi:hypothetical protein